MAFKLPVLKAPSPSSEGILIDGIKQIPWTDVKEKSKIGGGSFGDVSLAIVKDKLVVVKKLEACKKPPCNFLVLSNFPQ